MTNGERKISDAIAALKAALVAGDEAEEVISIVALNMGAGDPWTDAELAIQKCLTVLTSKSVEDLAAETWGAPTDTTQN